MRDFALETHFSKWEFNAKYHMTASDCESMSVPELLAFASEDDVKKYNNLTLGYTQTWGDPDLRKVIADTYDTLSPENILCFAGAEEGVYVAMRVLLKPHDHAIVIVPNYQAAETIPLDICEVSGVALREEENWRLDIEDVAAAIRSNTRLISVNFPNNPTGAIPSQRDFLELIALCKKHDIYLFSDEVYRLVERDDTRRLPQAADIYEKAISLNVCSKAYGFPGLRIGWVASQDRTLLVQFEKYKHYLSICNSAPSERLAIIVLKNAGKIIRKNKQLIAHNLDALNSFFAEYPDLFDWSIPDGGCIGFPRFKGKRGVEHFCQKLIQDAGVLLLPASIYHSELLATPKDRFRIGYGRKNIHDGLNVMRQFIELNRDEL